MHGLKRRLLLIGGAWILIPWTAGIVLEVRRNRGRRAAEQAEDDAAEADRRGPGPGTEDVTEAAGVGDDDAAEGSRGDATDEATDDAGAEDAGSDDAGAEDARYAGAQDAEGAPA